MTRAHVRQDSNGTEKPALKAEESKNCLAHALPPASLRPSAVITHPNGLSLLLVFSSEFPQQPHSSTLRAWICASGVP